MADDIVKVEINGREYEARKGEMLIRVTDRNGIYVPRFCYHEKLSVAANCRMCLVDIEQAPKPMVACATPVMDGMKVQTRSTKALESQRATMEFLLINHPLDCPICDQGGECELQDLALGFGSAISQYTERKRVVRDKDIGPLISTDMTRCIHCTRCIRFLEEVSGVQELGATGRSEFMRVGTYIEKSIDHEMSGNVIDLCPVGALNSKPFRFRARGWEMTQHEAVGPHDGLGSGLYAHVLRGELLRVVPRQDDSINETWISDRDRYSYEGIYADDRVPHPLVKRNGEWEQADWQSALDAAADVLDHATRGDGDQLGVLTGAGATIEEHYLVARLARALGSPHIDHRLRQTDFRDAESDPLYPSLGQGIDAFERNDAVLVIGSNLRKEAPILAHRLRKAAMRGAVVAFINPRSFEWYFPVLAQRVLSPAAQLDELAALASKKTQDDTQRAIISALTEAGQATILLGHLAHAHPRFADLRAYAARIADKTGATLAFLPHGGNAAGAALAGMLPHRAAGGRPAPVHGLDARAMFEQPRKAYLLLGVEPELDALDGATAQSALERAGVVVMSPYADAATLRHADVILPVGSFAETAGTLVNAAGTWRSWKGIARPYADSRPAWKVLRVLGSMHGLDGFEFEDIAEVRDALAGELDGVVPAPFRTSHTPAGGRKGATVTSVAGFMTYAGDPVVRRAVSLQKTRDARDDALLRVHPVTAGKLGVTDGARVRMGQAEYVARLDDGIAADTLWVPHGMELYGDNTLEVIG